MWVKLNDSWYWFKNNVMQAGPFASKQAARNWLMEQEAA